MASPEGHACDGSYKNKQYMRVILKKKLGHLTRNNTPILPVEQPHAQEEKAKSAARDDAA